MAHKSTPEKCAPKYKFIDIVGFSFAYLNLFIPDISLCIADVTGDPGGEPDTGEPADAEPVDGDPGDREPADRGAFDGGPFDAGTFDAGLDAPEPADIERGPADGERGPVDGDPVDGERTVRSSAVMDGDI